MKLITGPSVSGSIVSSIWKRKKPMTKKLQTIDEKDNESNENIINMKENDKLMKW